LNIAVSILEVGHSVELSRTAYFDDFENIPKRPFLLGNNNLSKLIAPSELSEGN